MAWELRVSKAWARDNMRGTEVKSKTVEPEEEREERVSGFWAGEIWEKRMWSDVRWEIWSGVGGRICVLFLLFFVF